MSASSVHDVPIFLRSTLRLHYARSSVKLCVEHFELEYHYIPQEMVGVPSLHEMYLEYFLRYYWHSNFRRQH
jgi:hypothetical protein